MKPLITLLTAALLSTASLTAYSEGNMESRFKTNPNPQQAYRIKIKINDAPGPLKLISDMNVGYRAPNCSYIINRIAGATTHPEKDVSYKIHSIGHNEYETVVYLDAVLDEDYFGDGICCWQPEGFGLAFKATGKPEETAFNFSDFINRLIEKKMLIRYYWKGGYPYYLNDDGTIYNHDDVVNFGNPPDKLDNYTDEQKKDLFTITATLEGVK